MDPVRTLIVEDERLARARLVRLLRQRSDVEIVGSAADGDEAVELIAGARPELLLLDIQIPSRSGFDVLGSFDDDELPFVIFTTAFSEHALRAFEVHALDYLLKPFDEERLHAAIDRAVKIVRGTRQFNEGRAPLTRLIVREPGRILFLDAGDVDWIEAAENYVYLHAGAKKHLVRGTIKSFAQRLDPARFARIHRSVIVNLARVKELLPRSAHGDYEVMMADGTRLVASRHYAAALRKRSSGERRLCRRSPELRSIPESLRLVTQFSRDSPAPFPIARMRTKQIATWILTLLLCAMFLNAGLRKFFENGGWSWAFRNRGLPVWFRIAIGVVETGAAAMLLVPRTAPYGAMAIMAVMIGAIGMFAMHGRMQHSIAAIVSLVVAGIVLALRWKVRYSFQRRMDSIM
jgi:two-component system, LytTR family, response regulator